jgi:hypothetical protein
MNDNSGEHTHKSLGDVLGALGPGGMTAIRFDDYKRLFGAEPTEDELEGQRAAGSFAAKHGCEHEVDHPKRQVWFRKK